MASVSPYVADVTADVYESTNVIVDRISRPKPPSVSIGTDRTARSHEVLDTSTIIIEYRAKLRCVVYIIICIGRVVVIPDIAKTQKPELVYDMFTLV